MATYISLCGINPQIIIEGILFPLVKEKDIINKIYIIITNEILNILDKIKLRNELKNLYAHYKITANLPIIRYISADINPRENIGFKNYANFLIKACQEISETDTKFYFNIAAGYKSMSVLFFKFISFYFDNSKIFHIITDKKFENSKKYFPKNINNITFIEIPFISYKKIINANILHNLNFNNVKNIENNIQKSIEQSVNPKIRINKKNLSIDIKNTSMKLKPFNFAVYIFFIKQNKPILGGKIEFTKEYFNKIYSIHKTLSKREIINDYDFNKILKAISEIKTNFKNLTDLNQDKYIIKSKGKKLPKKYFIDIDRDKIEFL